MLTLGNANTTQAKNYYKQENYYSHQEAEANSAWHGQGASRHQLSGAITDLVAYDNIVNGLSPDGKTQLRQKQNHKGKKERAGTDLTFSAPKSVSIACLVGSDTRLEEAHRKAVARTIDLIESRYAQTRINEQIVKTDNLIVAKWHHDTSRELDPHLHTHCLIMNCTQGPDGKWRTIDNKPFYQHKILLGQIYRNELALLCRKLGYEIESHPQELFEIKGYTREQIEGFSKRHEQIKDKLIEMGAELTTENKAWAWRKTRAKKNHEIRREEKLPYWQEEADLYGITHPVTVHGQAVESTSNEQDEQIAAQIKLAVDAAIEHCSERQVAFRAEDIEKFVTAEVQRFSIHQLESAISTHPELIRTYDGQRYTTQTALARELATIKLMQQGKGQVEAIASQEAIDSYLADKQLTSGQREAVALSATTSDQFIAWQGVAGAGKTYALNQVKQVATALSQIAPGYTIKGFAPSAEAAKVLEEELGIEANTVARLLISKQMEKPPSNQIWIVDEAGLLSAKNAHALLERATGEGARVILVGDTRQLSAIEAGNPFKSLQSAGIATAHLDESLRQKPPDLQKAVGLAANGQLGAALSHLQQLERLEEVADAQERTTKIATDYISLPLKERQETLIVAGTHQERCAITEEIRTALKEEGTLGYGVEVTQLRAKQNLTAVQARYTHNYNVGDVVVPIREYKRLGLHKSQPYRVEAIRGDQLHLSDLAGNGLVVDPMKFRKTLYQQENIDIAVGDRLRWTRNDKELGRRNGQEFTVTGIDGHTATIELQGGKTDTIDLYQPLHLDHALVATTYSSQGKTANRVFISSTVDATVSQESVYVAISRAKYDLKIYAQDIDYLLEEAQESKAQETVLELLQPKAKAQVAAVSTRARASSIERSADVSITPKLSSKNSTPVISIERPLKRKDQQAASSTPSPILKKQPPKQLEVFWQPTSASQAPPHIEAKHWQELVEGSAIHPDIAALNFRSLQMGNIEQEHQAWEYLMYSDKLERTNIGQLTTGMLKRYAHIEAGGWWCNSGANALSFANKDTGSQPQEKIWGCYKPNQPRSNPDKPGKVIKYEHPPKTDLGIFLLDVPDYVAQKIYARAGIDPSQEDRERGFWYCVWKHDLPIVITEGAKKAASLLSQGHAAIGLPGIYAGYRSKDEQGNLIKAHLHEELATFATLGRSISFCFDFETRLETKQNIEIAISRTGSLLRQQGAKVSVVNLPGPEKGVDDLIVAHSPLAFEQQLVAALPLQQWREVNKQQRHSTIAPPQKLSIEQRRERLNQSLSGQPPVNNQSLNRSQEQIFNDIIEQRQSNDERAADAGLDLSQSHAIVDQVEQEGRSIRENQHSTECEARPINHHWQSTEQTDYSLGERTNTELGRIESQSSELSPAISRHPELQEVEQLGADIAELDHSLADAFRSIEGTEQASQIIAHEEKLPRQLQRSQTQENLSQSGEYYDGRDTGTQCDRQLDSQHGGVESSEHRSFAAERQLNTEYGGVESSEPRIITSEQGTTDVHPQAIEHYSLDSQADAGRLHHPVTGSYGAKQIGQTERNNPSVSDINEQSVAQAGGYQHDSSPSQRTGDGSLRGDYQPAETISEQWQELSVSSKGEWAQAVGDLAQVVQAVGVQQLLSDAELERQLTKLAQKIQNLNLQQRKSYKFTGLSELAQAISQQQFQGALATSLEELGQQMQAVDAQITQVRSFASALSRELQPKITELAGTINHWQEEALIASAISQIDGIAQQLEQRHSFDFGDLPQLLNGVSNEQLLSQSGLVYKLATLTEHIAALTTQSPTRFEGISALAEDLQAVQAQSQLLQTDLINKLNAIALPQEQVVDLEIAQVRSSASALSRELRPGIETLAGAINQWQSQVEVTRAITQIDEIIQQLEQKHTFDFGDLPQLLNGASNEQLLSQLGLDTKLTTLSEQIAALTTKSPTQFEGINALAENLQALQAQSQLSETDLTQKLNAIAFLLANSDPQAVRYEFEAKEALSELAQTLGCFNTEQQLLLEGGLLEQLQQTTSKAISAISQHIEQSKEDLSMLQTVERTKAFTQALAVTVADKKEAVAELTQQLRDLSLDEIAPRLGLTRDKHDKHKWRGEGQIISINDQKFYDHLNLKGGYGAIDLVMHVQGREFKEALQWLAHSANTLPPAPTYSSQPELKAKERQPFQPPIVDESKWLAVRQYLVEKRQLPAALVDQLHSQGKVYADAKQNAVFLRQDVDGNLTGASLRGTYNDTPFKGLSTGSQREGGWFSFVQGEGELKRIVIVESAIDALSAAALSKQPEKTMFVSTDGAGSVPVSWLKQQQQQGIEIVAAHDSDRAGEVMAWRLATELGAVTRAMPTVGKDWNEQLRSNSQQRRIEPQLDPAQWKLVAQAIGKPDAYIRRIEAVVSFGQPLSTASLAAMQQDFHTYKQTANELWQWYQAAKEIGKSDAYRERITDCAIAFHHPQSPTPLSQEATATMQQDLLQQEQLLQSKLWQHDSPIADLTRPMRKEPIVAYEAVKDGYSQEQERLNKEALRLSIRLLSKFAKNQRSDRVSWTGGWYTFTKVGSDIKIDCNQRQATILELSNGNLTGSITQRDVEKFEEALEAIKTKQIVEQAEL